LSAWSVVAIVLAIGLCPFVTAAAIPAGLLALRDVSRNGRRGRRLAIAAIVLAAVLTPITTIGALWWNNHVRTPLLEGPAQLIAEGQHGDVAAFLEGTSSSESQEAAAGFLASLTKQLGIIRSTRPVERPEAEASPEGDDTAVGWWMWVRYEAMFEDGAVPMRARFLLSDPERGWVTAFDRFEVTTPEGGSLVWPIGKSVGEDQ
tara:strand:+ start:4036 stop:4647 length:612 start_codon:yes stop_codon:yes gene_type:complete